MDQLALYTDHLNRRDVLAEYADCYEKAYAQKHESGLYPREMPDRVDIDREAAEGVIVVIGYATQARGHLNSLRAAPGGSRLKVVELSHDLSAGIKESTRRGGLRDD
jgi:hypothetical protein